jgi:hypothetical protein
LAGINIIARKFPGVKNMPLQIRRGTDTERLAMAQPLAQGELLYTTDTKRIFVGDNATLGGVAVTGYTNEDAVDAVGAALVAGVHSGITFTYGAIQDDANRIDATVNISALSQNLNLNNFNIVGTGNVNISGTVFADLRGSLTSDNSTILVDAIDGKINLDGTVKGDIIPNSNEAYDLGSSSFRFRDLYLSGNSIKLGAATIAAIGSAVDLPAGSTVNGQPIVFPEFTNLRTDIIGSVFGDDSTLLVDGLTGNITNGIISLEENIISGSGTNRLIIQNDVISDESVEIKMLGSGAGAPTFVVSASLGTLNSPVNHAAGDEVVSMQFKGYADGVSKEAGGISVFWASTADMTSATPDSSIIFATRNNTDGFKVFRFDEKGVFTAPVLKATSYTTVNLPSGPDAGWIVFDSTSNQFKGWNGSSWVVLG